MMNNKHINQCLVVWGLRLLKLEERLALISVLSGGLASLVSSNSNRCLSCCLHECKGKAQKWGFQCVLYTPQSGAWPCSSFHVGHWELVSSFKEKIAQLFTGLKDLLQCAKVRPWI